MKILRQRITNLIFQFPVDCAGHRWKKHTYTLDYQAGKYRQEELTRIIRDAVTHFALTPDEFSELSASGDIGEMERKAWSRISRARQDKKGDYGELLLFILLSVFFPTKRFVTKVRLRSSQKEQIKGFDCAHFTIENGKPWLWLGEVKFHKSFSGALGSIVEEINAHCKPDYLEQELSILGSNIELNKEFDDYHAIDHLLNRGVSLDKINFKIPALITYDSKTIKNNSNHESDKFIQEMTAEFIDKFSKIEEKVINSGNNFEVMFLLIPMEDIKSIKKRLELIEEANR